MSKRRETAADRIWKEKLDLCISAGEAITLIVLVTAVTAFVSVIGF